MFNGNFLVKYLMDKNKKPVDDRDMALARRIDVAAKLIGTQGETAKRVGMSVGAIKSYISGATAPTIPVAKRIAEEAGVSFEWLATGKGEQPLDFTATLESIQQRLEKAAVPFPAPPPPEWRSVYDELREIAESPAATDNCRLRADTLLRLAFNDQDAIERFNINLKDMGTRLREGRAAYAAALKAVGWEPPQAIGFAIADAMVFNGLDYDGAVTILKALKDAV